MRIRTIKPEFFSHEAIFEAEAESGLPLRLAFIGLWCAADREGRFKWEPRRLGIWILPYDSIDFSRVLDALLTRGFIRQYRVDGGTFGLIPSFLRHQIINNRERESEIPEPLELNDIGASLTRGSRVGHAASVEGMGREQGKEGNIRADDARLFGIECDSSNPLPANWRKLKPAERQRTKVRFNTSLMIQVGQLLGRRETTLWSIEEAVALDQVRPHQDDIADMLPFYSALIPKDQDFRRREIITLLNNWNGELDKARGWAASQPTTQAP